MNDERPLPERIVEMLCDGLTYPQIEKALNISRHTLDQQLSRARYGAGLPWYKASYKGRKAECVARMEKWRAHLKARAELDAAYYDKLERMK